MKPPKAKWKKSKATPKMWSYFTEGNEKRLAGVYESSITKKITGIVFIGDGMEGTLKTVSDAKQWVEQVIREIFATFEEGE